MIEAPVENIFDWVNEEGKWYFYGAEIKEKHSGCIVDMLLTESEQQSKLQTLQYDIDSISSKYGAEGVSVALIENGKVTEEDSFLTVN